MTKISLGGPEARSYEFGVDRGVFFPYSNFGIPWNGLVAVQENEEVLRSVIFLDGQQVQNRLKFGSFEAKVQAFTYPDEFQEYEGFIDYMGQQRRKSFGFSYRTMLDRDKYKLHIVYNAMAAPSLKANSSLDSSNDPTLFEWDFTSAPTRLGTGEVLSHIVIDSSFAHSWTMSAVEDVLYGSDNGESRLPTPDEILNIFEINSILRVIDNGDGSFTVTGPDEAITMLNSTTFEINWPSAIFIGEDLYQISSL